MPTTPIQSVQVTVADGGKLTTKEMVPQLTWWTQGHSFSQDARVLPLKTYDLILGMDWLETHSPMWVDWKRKKMRFTYKGWRITLVGVKDCTSQCLPLKSLKLKGLLKRGAVAQLVQLQAVQPTQSGGLDIDHKDQTQEEITRLIEAHSHIFQEPKQLPPQRSFDNSIPVLAGVKPVNIKPYWYNPTQKDEIERQVKEMLDNGIIQSSMSPYASPVLLVKKKDGPWRFCVDYR